MGWVALALAVFKLIFKSWDLIGEVNAVKKAKKKEALDEVKKGIRDRDPSRITAGFDVLDRL